MSKTFFFLLVATFFIDGVSLAQKKVEKLVDARGISGVVINDDSVFQIEVTTGNTDKITMASVINGENFETAYITSEVVDGMLQISSSRAPYFKDVDDKLAAHKVLSITLMLIMPENLELWIDSSLASVKATGEFSLVNLNLGRGDCSLRTFRGSGTVNTLSGAIHVETLDCKIEAESRHGIKNVDNTPRGTAHLQLRSLTGDITVTQNQ
ncbi:hypothetical protein [Flavimarina sp. Hel_I_48]|uniref:hypothetical protein n=1 Tax=Flavimarina sp. Hel_I_48 TaxID=1392488 RepID=UPI0004DF1E5F|nr:hypothetical protein [Flavimarina sp. Hel_I_48]